MSRILLIVSDDPKHASHYSGFLTDVSVRIISVSEFSEEVSKFEDKEPVGLLVVENINDDESFLETFSVFRQRCSAAHTLYLADYYAADQQKRFQLAGIEDYIVKPVSSGVLLSLAHQYCEIKLNSMSINGLNNDEIFYLVKSLDKHAIVSMTDASGTIIYVNEKFCEISGYDESELLGQNHRILKSGKHEDSYYKSIWQSLTSGKVWEGNICNRAKDGSYYWVKTSISPFTDKKTGERKYVSIRTDVSKLYETTRFLEESEERYRKTQLIANIGSWEWNIKTDDLYWSDGVPPLFGYQVGELKTSYENFYNAIHPEDREKVTNKITACIEGSEPYNVEHRVVWPDGTVRWVLEKGDVFTDENGKPERMLGVVHDIHDRKIAEIEVLRFNNILDKTNDGIYLVDADDFSFRYVNRGVLEQLNYAESELLGESPDFIEVDLDKKEMEEKLSSLKSSETTSIRYETLHRKKDGSVIPVELSLQYVTTSDGEPIFVIVSRDITERHYLEEKLSLQSRMLDMLRTATLKMISLESFELTTNYMLKELMAITSCHIGYMAKIVETDEEKNLETIACCFDEIATNKVAGNCHNFIAEGGELYQKLMKSLSSRHPDVLSSAIEFSNSQFNKMIAVPVYYAHELVGAYVLGDPEKDFGAEINELLNPFTATYSASLHFNEMQENDRKNKKELLISKERAEMADKAKSEFLASMSHELRTPLNAILGYSEIAITSADMNESMKSNIVSIHKAGKHLLELVNDVLDLSKIEAGKLEMVNEPIQICELISDCIDYIKPLARTRGIGIHNDCESLQVWADYTRLRQVILNVMNNAIKYNHPEGSVFITAKALSNKNVEIAIQDNGIGIKATEQKHVFEPFKRLANKMIDQEGTGIGLVVAKNLLESLNGSIDFVSEFGAGSTFYIRLPAFNNDKPIITGQVIKQPPEITQFKVSSNQELQQGILLAEDNVFNQDLIKKQLAACGFDAKVVANGALAEDEWLTGQYRLILSDINMPEMDGYQLISKIREKENQTGEHVSVVALTANAMSGEREKCLKLGFDEYLSKPLSLAGLQKILAQFLNSEDVTTHSDDNILSPSSERSFDPSVLAHLVGDNKQNQENLLNIFVEDSPNTFKQLQKSIRDLDFKQIVAHAHKLKSSTRAIGAKEITDVLQTYENAGKKSDKSIFHYPEEDIETKFNHLLMDVCNYLGRDVATQASPSVEIDIQRPWKDFHVLIIDDDKFILNQLKLYFSDMGVLNVQLEDSAVSALLYLSDNNIHVDLIITDLNMPYIDGISFMRSLSEKSYSGFLAFVSGEDSRLLNSVVQLGNEHKLNVIGAIEKPISQKNLLDLMNRASEQSAKKIFKPSLQEVFTPAQIYEGLKQNKLKLFYQPKISLESMQVNSIEALARWEEETGKILSPDHFIPVAENDPQLMYDLTIEVCKIAVRQIKQWQDNGFECSVAVNFSMKSLERIEIPQELTFLCTEYEVKPSSLIIEITESAIMENVTVALEVISRLHLLGFKLSIDDFGTGYSSMDQLRKLPFSEIKLDRSFVSSAASNAHSYAILESSIGMARKLNMSIVSEGVETEEDLELLKKLGSDLAQGYYFSKPLPPQELSDWLSEWKKGN